MKNIFYLFCLLTWSNFALAQTTTPTCGFEPDAATIQRMNQHHDAIARFKTDPASSNRLREVKRVPLRFVAFNAGKTAGLSQADVNLAVSTLNKAFLPAGIEFFSCQAPINVISSPYANYLISEERALWQEFKASKVINVFCVESIEYGSVAGYTYLPGSGAPEAVFMLRTHLNQPTFAHEMGHYYGLYHTHGKSNCETLTDELVNGSNCEKAGDDVCDTPADPNLQGLGCYGSLVNSSTCTYTGTAKDKNGDLFQPDPKNIMSYAPSRCRTDLTPGQYERIRYFSQFRNYPEECPPGLCSIPVVTNIDSTYNSVKLSWTAFAEDSLYQVRYRNLGDTEWKLSNLISNQWTLSNLKPCTKLEVQVRRACGASFSNWTNVLSLKTLGCGGIYCGSFGGSNTAWLNRVGIGTWSYTSGDNKGFLLRENSGLSLANNTEYSVQLEPGGTLRIRDTLYWEIWVDANRDRDFEDAGERVYQSKSAYRIANKGTFSLPATLSTGSSRMRIILSLNNWAQGPCDTSAQVIETEDYVINLQAPQTCKTPSRTNITLRKVTTTAVTLKAQGLDAAKYQWELRQWVNDQLVYLSPELSIDSLPFSGLTENTRYQVRLRTLCKNGVYSTWSDTLTFRTLAVVCSSPDFSTLMARQVSVRAAQVNCGAQPGAVYYQFQYRIKGSDTWINSSILRVNNEYLTGLQAGTTYEFRAKVYCSTNLSSGSEYSKAAQFTTLAACNAPDSSSLKVSQLTHQSAVLQCATVVGAALYEFSFRAKNSTGWLALSRTSSPAATVQGLKPGTVYEFRARVYCTTTLSESSAYSKVSSFRTAPEPCKLPNRDSIRIAMLGDSVLLFNYSDTSTYYQSYAWRYRKRGTTNWINLIPGQSAAIITEFGVDYEVTVQGSCGADRISDWSPVKIINVPCLTPKVRDLSVFKLRFNYAQIVYRGPKTDGILWQYKALNASVWSTEAFLNDTSIFVGSLQPSTTYQFRLRTRCKPGVWSAASTPLQFTTPEYPCNFPDSNTFAANLITDVSVRLSCSVVPGAVTYTFSHRKVGTLPWTSLFVYSAEALITNLQPSTAYEFTVQSNCRYNDEWIVSPPRAYRRFVTLPKICPPVAHGDIQVQYQGERKMRASCSPGAEAYTWRYRSLGTSTWSDSITLDSAAWIIGGLKYPAQYEIQVKQKCVAGNWSEWSTAKKFLTHDLTCPIPDARNIKIVASGDTVHFEYVGDQTKRYHWRMRVVGDSIWQNVPDSVLDRGLVLTTAATYDIAVQAMCTNGEVSEWSNPKMLTWPCSTVQEHEIVIREVRPHFASIHCTAPSEGGYHWRYREFGQNNWLKEITTLTGDVLFEHLNPESVYEFQVQRLCSDIGSAYSPGQLFVTPALPVGASCLVTPAQVHLKALSSGQLELSNDFVAQRYFWAYRQQDELDWEVQFQSTTNTARFDSLVPGKTYIIGTRVLCPAEDFTEWLYLIYQPSCAVLSATDIRIQTTENHEATLECTNAGFIAHEWRYRLYGAGTDWIYVAGNKARLTQLLETLYEVQVRGFCSQMGAWSFWSDSRQFSSGNCKLPTALSFAPKFVNVGSVDVVLESSSADWKINHFKWSYRELGRRNWIDTLVTEEALLSVSKLIPGATYEFRVEAICFSASPDVLVYSGYVIMPKACFVPAMDRIKVERITQTSAHIELDYNFYLPFEISYRIKGSQSTFKTINGLLGNVPNLTGLIPDTEYEMRIRIQCDGAAAQTPAIYFKTQSCDIPYAGAVVLDAINPDYVEARVESHNFHPPANGLTYVWKYKLKNATVWDSIATGNDPSLYLAGLQPESAYDLKAVLHCPNKYADSIEFVTSFKTLLDKCSDIEGSNHVIYPFFEARNEYFISCTLPPDYYFSIRFWVRFKDDPTNHYWEFSVSDSLKCGWAVFVPNNSEDNQFYFQARIACPGGNYSPWSDTIRLDIKHGLFHEDIAQKLIRLQNPETVEHEKLLISPNPSTGQFKVVLPTLETSNSIQFIEVFNVSGQKVYSKKLEAAETNLDLSAQPSGLYFLRANVGGKVFTERLVIASNR